MRATRFSSYRLAALFVPTAIALAACGGSDDPPAAAGDGGGGGTVALSIGGTAAMGAAIAGGTVDAQCAVGDGAVTTAADGSYVLQIQDGKLPCTLRVVSGDGATVLHSAAAGSGNSARANLTPATELAMAQLYGRNPAAVHDNFNATAVVALTPAALQAAARAITTLLAGVGVAIGGDPISGPLAIGDANDQALDALKTQLAAAGLTLTQLGETVAQGSPATPITALSATPSLPAEWLLRPAAPNCAALRSGTYRIVFFAPGDGGEAFTDTVVLDAPTLKATSSDGTVDVLTATGECQYAVATSGEMLVTPAGVGVFRSGERPGFVAAMIFPEQRHPVSATAGTWNYLGLGDTDGSFGAPHLFGGEMTVNASGKVTAGIFCDEIDNCVAESPNAPMVFTSNAAGGFDFDGSRAFAYRAGSGELMIVYVDRDGSFALATRKVARTLPAVGTINRNRDFTVTPQFNSPAPGDSENTAVSLAGDGLSYGRDAIIDFATGATRPETIQINMPRDGFAHRVPGTVTTSTGGSAVVGEWVALTLRGIGITPVAIVNNNNMILSVRKP
jgi:hypothetical protein